MASGNQLSDTPGAGAGNEYIFFAGQRIAWVDSSETVRYYWGDHLGTTRVVTDASGNVCYDADFYPFQGERSYITNCTPAFKFAGMKFDQESGDYYTLNRYYPPNLGRWLTPDPVAGDISNPQSLNRYAYALNNPCNLTDPLGLDPCSYNIVINTALKDPGFISSLQDEIQRIFGLAGLGMNFTGDRSAADYTLGVVKGVSPNAPNAAGEAAQGYIGGPILNFGFVYAGTMTRLVPATGVSYGFLATALGRAGAHEMGHYLLQQTGHVFSSGLMAAGFSGATWYLPDPTGTSFAFTPDQVSQLQKDCRKRRSPGRGGGGVGTYPSGDRIPGWVWTFACPSGYHSDGTGHCVNDNPPGDF
jgi:RHS repeat-associated protein